ncbi:MAG TPA: preprotein translocase subunit YajC [Oligoflexia bacterium]|nr:preprotein translocase subunit YajC [Oligoflexia bacterium]HMP26531.1 preprotein translocase subunit YajC [Oligoflexia bacterium]
MFFELFLFTQQFGVGAESGIGEGVVDLVGQAHGAQSNLAQPSFFEVLGKMSPMFLVVFGVFYIMTIRPQQAKLRAQQELVSSLKKGETIITSAGIVGKILAIEDQLVSLDLGNNARLKIKKEFIVARHDAS